jgi:hypothetical protein
MQLGRSLVSSVALGGLLLTGCSTFAIYRHPVTGEVMECETNPGLMGAGHAFADCKNTLEERGYERVGTRRGDQQNAGSSEPQPAKAK